MKKILIVAFFLLSYSFSNGQTMNYTFENHKYAQKESAMYLDLYKPLNVKGLNKTVVYVFGGGFVVGDKRSEGNVDFYKRLVDNGYNVIAIDYRLGLKGVKKVGITNPKPPFAAVKMATEDLTSAVEYIIANNEKLGVDTSKMVLIGSSAGAITVLQMDYQLANRTEMVKNLPGDFKFAGVVSMAGAIFSTQGMPKYKSAPSPTFFLHGTSDKVVVYNKMKFFRLAMVGSDPLARIFTKNGFPFVIYRYEGSSHEVAEFPREYALKEILWFIDEVAFGKKDLQMDVMIRDGFVKKNYVSEFTDLNSLYNN